MNGRIISINVSDKKGQKKHPVAGARLIKGLGIEGDAHAGSKRQVSLLAIESIRKMSTDLRPGDFAENITTEGIDLLSLPVGSQIRIADAVLEITEHGKVCHDRCEIFERHGRCVMPEEGIFAKVVSDGVVSVSSEITLL